MRKGCRVHIRSKVGVGDDAVTASTGLPPDCKVGGLEVWSDWSSAVACGLSVDWSWISGRACKNPWRLNTGKRFPAWFPHVWQGEVYLAGPNRAPRRKIPKADSSRRATSGPGLPRRGRGDGAGLQPKGGHLVPPCCRWSGIGEEGHRGRHRAAGHGHPTGRTPSARRPRRLAASISILKLLYTYTENTLNTT
jgi:hypothetical protein